jgi:hypothetical protein
VIESTSTYHRPIAHLLHGEFAPIMINPALAGSAKKKADKYDATLLAYHGLTGIWDPSYLPSGLQPDLTMGSRRLMKAIQGITKATTTLGTRLIDANLLLPQEIQMRSASARAIVQAIVEGLTDPVEAVKRATYYPNQGDMPDRQVTYQRLLGALTALPSLSQSPCRVLGALLKDVSHHERQCVVSRHWMDELLHKLTLSYPDGRTVTGEAMVSLLNTIPGVGNRYGEVFVAEAGLDVVKRFGSAGA